MQTAELAKIVIAITEITRQQQVEIRELRGRLYAYETKVLSPLNKEDTLEFRKEEAAQLQAARGAAQDELTALISELRALLRSEGVSL